MPERDLASRSGLAALVHDHGVSPAGLSVTDLDGTGIASLHVYPAQRETLVAAFRTNYGFDLPAGPQRLTKGGMAAIGTGPGRWLVTQDGTGNELATRLQNALGALAAVNDQTDGYVMVRLAGPALRRVLAKGVGIDLDKKMFPVGAAASTAIAHFGVTMWRCPDAAEGVPVFELVFFRSLAGTFWHWLSSSAAEYGLETSASPRG